MVPKYKYEDKVLIDVHVGLTSTNLRKGQVMDDTNSIKKTVVGSIYITDANGNGSNNHSEPSYDVYVKKYNMLYKHITESKIRPYEGGKVL